MTMAAVTTPPSERGLPLPLNSRRHGYALQLLGCGGNAPASKLLAESCVPRFVGVNVAQIGNEPLGPVTSPIRIAFALHQSPDRG